MAKPGATVISDARDVLLAARSVHLIGAFTGSSAATSNVAAITTRQQLDLRLAKSSKGIALATGTMTTATTSAGKTSTVRIELVRVGGQLYIRGDRAYYQRIGPKAAAVAGRWLTLTITQDRSVADVTDISQLAAGLSGASAATTKGLVQFGSRTAVLVRIGDGAAVYVAAEGSPQLLRLQRPAATGALAGTLDFSDYNATLAIRPPSGAIGIAKVRG